MISNLVCVGGRCAGKHYDTDLSRPTTAVLNDNGGEEIYKIVKVPTTQVVGIAFLVPVDWTMARGLLELLGSYRP